MRAKQEINQGRSPRSAKPERGHQLPGEQQQYESQVGPAVAKEMPFDEEGTSMKRTELYGIKYAQNMRRNGYMGKILFLSFLTNPKILEMDPKNGILNSIGHGFSRLPLKHEEIDAELNKTNSLTEIEFVS